MLDSSFAPMRVFLRLIASSLPVLLVAASAVAQTPPPVEYKLSFADAAHHVMQVEVTFPEVKADPLQVRMARSSPGRYAAHDFAKNVFEVKVTDGKGRALTPGRPNPHQWDVAGHGGTVRITYKIYGNHVDGTYLAVDASHAHMNIPATLMWARGLDMRPARVTLAQPPPTAGVTGTWKVATQLFPTNDPLTFTAPNVQYLMDSPIEFSDHAVRTFRIDRITTTSPSNGAVGGAVSPVPIRVTMHHTGTDAELDAFTKDVEKIVREQVAVFGEMPMFDNGNYTFLADYLPWGGGDGMEHRNSTVIASTATLASNRMGLLGTASHEFFHAWNVERIRPKTLEPFSFEDANISGELWLAEGFTNYYGRLTMLRADLREDTEGVGSWSGVINGVNNSPGTKFRSAVEMSRLAPFVDAAVSIDSTYWPNTFYSYYTFGEAIALGLDLTLRDRSDSKITLDDYMRAMWTTHGKPGGPAPGLVARPYTLADARARLAEVSGDKAFADDFFTRYIEGTERIDYTRLLERAGFLLRPASPGRATLGQIRGDSRSDRLRMTGPAIVGSPLHAAGLDLGDEIVAIAETKVSSPGDVDKALASRKPGDEVAIVFMRHGVEKKSSARLVEDPRLEVVTFEKAGRALTDAHKKFREAWLASKVRAAAPTPALAIKTENPARPAAQGTTATGAVTPGTSSTQRSR
jgi:predicted metalloprotease with PDZ domain